MCAKSLGPLSSDNSLALTAQRRQQEQLEALARYQQLAQRQQPIDYSGLQQRVMRQAYDYNPYTEEWANSYAAVTPSQPKPEVQTQAQTSVIPPARRVILDTPEESTLQHPSSLPDKP
jgi:hypothetical protein